MHPHRNCFVLLRVEVELLNFFFCNFNLELHLDSLFITFASQLLPRMELFLKFNKYHITVLLSPTFMVLFIPFSGTFSFNLLLPWIVTPLEVYSISLSAVIILMQIFRLQFIIIRKVSQPMHHRRRHSIPFQSDKNMKWEDEEERLKVIHINGYYNQKKVLGLILHLSTAEK